MKRLDYHTADGMRVVLEESHALPLVDFEIDLRTGCVEDPDGLEGLTRLGWRMVRMGTRGTQGHEVEEAISRLGARLVIETSSSYVRLHGVVIRRNLEPFLELVSRLVYEPAFRAADLAHVKREAQADLVARRDSDRALAARAFRSALFGEHPYARSSLGTKKSLRAIRRDVLRAHFEQRFTGPNAIFGAAGAVTPTELRRLVDRHFSGMSRRRVKPQRVPPTRVRRGRRVVVVDKPARTQTQIFVGTLGTRMKDPLYYPLMVANTAFGGTFTSPLMQEVREKRGWSYGAYSRLHCDHQREAWSMWTHPASTDAVDCIALQLDLLDRFVDRGPSRADHSFAKKSLVNGHCFDVDTASKRLDPHIDSDLFGLPLSHYTGYEKHVRAVKRADSAAAVKKRISSRDVTIALLATAKDVVPGLEKLPGVRDVTVIPYDRL